MRQDKLTTKLQEALADAQSVAVGNGPTPASWRAKTA